MREHHTSDSRRRGEPLHEYIARRIVKHPDGCHEWTGCQSAKYPRIAIAGVHRQLSHVVLEHKLGRPIKDGMVAMHSCDRSRCVNPDHLSEGTPRDNTADMIAKGRSKLQHYKPKPMKLTEDDVRAIRAAVVRKRSATDGVNALAARYGVTPLMIWRIRHRQSWANVA
jgi:hypothetical protein